MSDYSLSVRKVFIGSYLVICICAVSACGGSSPPNAQMPFPTCVSPVVLNPYGSRLPPTHVTNLYAGYKNGSIPYQNARQDAFSQLGDSTKRWSDYKDIVADNQHMIRIVITYLDPILVQYILLNNALAQNTMDVDQFNAEIQQAMLSFEQRNEMLFIIIVTSPLYGQPASTGGAAALKMPVDNLTFINASGARVKPTHYDHVLVENIDMSHGPVYGIVGYPIAVSYEDTCAGIIDPWMTSLTLGMKSPIFAGRAFDELFWNIPYQSLIAQDDYHPTPTFDPFFYDRLKRAAFDKLNAPPTPNWQPATQAPTPAPETNWKAFWDDMGRYIWGVVMNQYGR